MSGADRQLMDARDAGRTAGIIYYLDIVEDYPQLGGVAAFSGRLRRALKDRYGSRMVSARSMALRLGCADSREAYLDRERRAIERLAVLDPDATILVPNFQNPVGRVPGRPRPTMINVVHDVQFCHLPELFGLGERNWLHAAFAETRRNADEVVFVSATTQRQYEVCFGLPRRSAVIQPPIRTEAAKLPPVSGRQPFLLAVQHASSHPHKNIAGLLRLFAGLAERSPELRLRIAGHGREAFGPGIDDLPEEVRGRVDHLGYVTRRELDILYRTARAFVSMSRFEGFNMSAAEAAAHGTPMILSDLPVHRELHAGRACFLDLEAPSVEAAEDYLRAPAPDLPGHKVKRAVCAPETVADLYAGLIRQADLERSRSAVLRHRGWHPGRAGWPVVPKTARFRPLASVLLAGTMVSGFAYGGSILASGRAVAADVSPCLPNLPSGGTGGGIGGGAGGTGCTGQAGMPGGSSQEANGSAQSSWYYAGAGAGGGGGAAGGGPGGKGGGYNNWFGYGRQDESFETSKVPGGQPGFPPEGGFGYYGGGWGGNGGTNGTLPGPGDQTANPIAITSLITGGAGGAGGNGMTGTEGQISGGSGGGGGGGGYGLVYSGTAALSITSSGGFQGGAGGNGGSGYYGNGGGGGAGGVGLFVKTSTASITNTGTISGGSGGLGGASQSGSSAGPVGAGGFGIVGQNLTIINGGTIAGGLGGDQVQAPSMYFVGGSNNLTLLNKSLVVGDIVLAGSLDFNQQDNFNLTSRIISATSDGNTTDQIKKDGSGDLTFSAQNTYSGGTIVNSGTLSLNHVLSNSSAPISFDSVGSGGIVLNGGTLEAAVSGLLTNQLTVSPAATATVAAVPTATFTLTGPLTLGSQSVLNIGSKSDTGTVIVAPSSASVDPSSQIVLIGGTLGVGNASAFGSASLSLANGTALTFSTDGLTLPNNVLFSGVDPTIDTGMFSETMSGVISGPGALTKQGSGTLFLTGNNTYQGATTIAAGTLVVDGSIGNSAVTVSSNTSLGGGGTVGSVNALANSTIAPGVASPYKSLKVNGNILFDPTSTYVVNINTSGQTDSIVATGTAKLNGANLNIREAPGSYADVLSPYPILSATSGVSGTFGTMTGSVTAAGGGNLPFVTPTILYGTNSVTLTFVRNTTPLSGVAATPNQSAVAGAIQTTITAPPANNSTSPPPATTVTAPPVSPTKPIPPAPVTPAPVTPKPTPPAPSPPAPTPPAPTQPSLGTAILGQTAAGAQQAFAAAAGTVHASTTASTIQTSRYVAVNVLDRLFSITGSGLDARQLLDQLSPNALPAFVNCFAPLPSVQAIVPPNLTVWGEGFGSFGSTAGSGNAAGIDHSLGGFVLGADTPLHGFSAPYRIGIAGGYTNDSFTTKGGGSGGTAESIFGSVYGSARYGNVDVRLGASYAANQTTLARTVAFPGFFETERSSYWGSTVQGFGELGYRFATSRWVLEPVADAALVHLHQDQFHEQGGSAALFGFSQDANSASTTLGVRGEAALFSGLPLVARAFLGWRHGYGDINPAATFAFASGSAPFSSSGAPIDHNAVAAEAGLDWRASSRLTLGVSYAGQIGERDMDNSVKGRAEYKF